MVRIQEYFVEFWIGEKMRFFYSNRVLRGGSWNDNAENCSSDSRNENHVDNARNNYGFRLLSTMLSGTAGPIPISCIPQWNQTCKTLFRQSVSCKLKVIEEVIIAMNIFEKFKFLK